jgi:hypothetical protein
MSNPQPTPEERYAEIVQQLLAQDSKVSSDSDSTKRRFGMSGGLKLAGKLFAFLARGRLIVKLPKQRVDSLVSLGRGERCEMGRGRFMKEWIAVGSDFQADWPTFVSEAKAFVSDTT